MFAVYIKPHSLIIDEIDCLNAKLLTDGTREIHIG